MLFSERMGFAPKKALQLDSIDNDLANSLWNAFYLHIVEKLRDTNYTNTKNNAKFYKYAIVLWSDFFKKKVETIEFKLDDCISVIRNKFDSFDWIKVYDFVDFNIQVNNDYIVEKYVNECNNVLKREASAYRIVDKQIVPISNELEIKEIEDAIFQTSIKNVDIHLKEALEKLSNRENPDYRNSIKESISAVESLCREITGEITLGKAINKFEKSGIVFNQQFKEALEKLYAYTNHKGTGIRHALIESSQVPDFDEAKFMLVACSAFINYLISKRSIFYGKPI